MNTFSDSRPLDKLLVIPLIAVLSTLLLANKGHAQITEGMAGLWNFDGSADDSSGNENHGTFENGASLSDDTPGDGGQSLNLEGGQQHVLVPHSDTLDVETGLTIAAWVKPDNNQWDGIVAKAPSDGGPANFPGNYELRTNNGGGALEFGYERIGGGFAFTPVIGTALVAGEWAHIAFTAGKGGTWKAYINGAEEGTGPIEEGFGLTNANPLYIGSRADLFTTFNGYIDELAIWTRELTAEEIEQLATGPVIGGPNIGLSLQKFSSAMTEGSNISTISTYDPANPEETYIYTLVAGEGDNHNDIFQISGDELQTGNFDFVSQDDGETFLVRIKATGQEEGEEVEGTFTLILNADSDSDNIPDEYELAQADDLTILSGLEEADADSDGITDIEEYELSMGDFPNIDPTNDDTDGDGLKDGEELAGAGDRSPTNPTNPDTDGDGLNDGIESNTGTFVSATDSGSDPLDADTDEDGTFDGAEVLLGTDPTDKESYPPVQLLGLWRFEGNADDSSINENHGTFENGATLSDEFPESLGAGQSLSMSVGVQHDEHVLVPHHDSLNITGKMTITAWIKPANDQWDGIIAKSPSDGGPANYPGNYELRTNNNGGLLEFGFEHDPGARSYKFLSPATIAVVAQDWSHVAFTAEAGGEYYYYVNGEVAGNGPMEAFFGDKTNTNPLYIGNRADLTTIEFHGLMDDVALFNGILGENQIRQIMTGDFGNFGIAGANLFTITEITLDEENAEIYLTFNSRPGKTYAVDYSVDAIEWSEIDDGIESEGTETTYIDPYGLEEGSPTLFYRIREL